MLNFYVLYEILHILSFVVFAQTSTPSATTVPSPTSPPTPTSTISLVLTNVPDGAYKGSQFSVNLNLFNAKPNLSYSFKVFGGPPGDNYSIDILNNNNVINGYNGSWASMPVATSDAAGNVSLQLNLQANPDKNSGSYVLTGKASETANTSKSILSNTAPIQINEPPTPTPTFTPTNTPTPSNTPTLTPTKTPTPTPTISITPTPSLEPTISPETVLGDSISLTASPLPTIKLISQKSAVSLFKSDLLPVVLIASGGIIILIPLIVSRLKK